MLDGPCPVPGHPEQVVKSGPDQGVGRLGGVGGPGLEDRGRHLAHGPRNQVTVVVGAAERSEDDIPGAVLQPELHGRPQGREVLVLLLARVRVRPASAQLLHRQTRSRPGPGQLPIDDTLMTAGPSGLREMSSREVLDAELQVLKIDVSQHLMEHHHRLLREEIGATDARHLRAMHPGQSVLVAGVRASTQTPPIPSGKRVIFVTLEDGSGLVDLAFFEDSHEDCAHTIFHNGLLLARGTVEARGPRRTVVGQMVWDLEELAAARRDHGPQAVLDILGRTTPAPTPAQPAPSRKLVDGTAGAKLHPYADLQPAGTRSADLNRLGHTSPGSPDL